MSIVVVLNLGVGDSDGAVGQGGVANIDEADVGGVGALGLLDLNLSLGNVAALLDEGHILLHKAVGDERGLNILPIERGLRILVLLLKEVYSHAAIVGTSLLINKELSEHGRDVLTSSHIIDLFGGNGNASILIELA